MILVRNVFQAKYGRGDELVQVLKDAQPVAARHGVRWQLLTDASGPFFNVVMQEEFESFADFEAKQAAMFADADFGPWFAKTIELVVDGRRDFFNIVE